MSKIDLYPNPGLVRAIRKDGYNKFGFDVFLMTRDIDTTEIDDDEFRKQLKAYEFIKTSIEITDKAMSDLKDNQKNDTLYYKTYSNTIEYLLEYYDFLIKNKLILSAYEVGARYEGGIIQDYIQAVNSNEPVLYTEDREVHGSSIPKLPTEISSWFSHPEAINYYKDHPFLIYIGGPEDRLNNWVYNMILVSTEKDKGFNYPSQLRFMNWKGNPLNR